MEIIVIKIAHLQSEIFGMAPLSEDLKVKVFDELIKMTQEDE